MAPATKRSERRKKKGFSEPRIETSNVPSLLLLATGISPENQWKNGDKHCFVCVYEGKKDARKKKDKEDEDESNEKGE